MYDSIHFIAVWLLTYMNNVMTCMNVNHNHLVLLKTPNVDSGSDLISKCDMT